MLECRDIDELMVDWLYQELDARRSSQVKEHVEGCARCAAEAGALDRTRAMFRDMDPVEPPAAVSAILLHEAARRAPASGAARAADDPAGGGLLDRIRAWLRPIVLHPAAAAAASVVVIAGVAGALLLRGGSELTETRSRSAASEAPAPESAAGEGAASAVTAGETTPLAPQPPADPAAAATAEAERGVAAGLPERGFAAGLIDAEQQAELRRQVEDSKDSAGDGLRERAAAEKKAPRDGKLDTGRTAARADSKPADSSKKKSKSLSVTSTRKSEPAPAAAESTLRGPVANAISGADELVDADDRYRGGALGSAAGPAGGAAPSGAPSTAGAPGGQPPMTAAELRRQQGKLAEAVAQKRCRDAAAIANDILDRNPDHYRKQVAGSREVKACDWYVSDERRRRATARSGNVGGGQNASKAGPQKARAAPERDEAAAPSQSSKPSSTSDR